MIVTTLVFGGLCFGAGIIAGVVLSDNNYLHTDDLKCAGGKVVEYTKTISRKVRREAKESGNN